MLQTGLFGDFIFAFVCIVFQMTDIGNVTDITYLVSQMGKITEQDIERAMASEILIGKTLLEALNTDLVCDAINTAMRELFLQIVYGRSQTAFSEGGLPVGASLEDLGKGLRSQVGTMFATKEKGPRYLEMAEGYCTRVALNKDSEIIGYEFVNLGKMMEAVKKGVDANEALESAKSHYGQWDSAAKYIDPRQE